MKQLPSRVEAGKPQALLARPNDLAAAWVKQVFEHAGLVVTEVGGDDDLSRRLSEAWTAVAVSTSVSSPVRAPWRQVLSRVAHACPDALLLLVTIDWSPDVARQLRPDFSLLRSKQPAEPGTRGVLPLTLKQLRDPSELRDVSRLVSERLAGR